MNRAEFILLLAGLACGRSVQAQRAPAHIAWVWPGSTSGEATRLAAFRAGMAENGLVEGQHFRLDLRFADGHYERFPSLVAEALAGQPAILMVVTIASVRVAQQATRTVPIIFVSTNDPLGSGLIDSYARPGGNSTGLSTQNEESGLKNLQLLHELLPQARRVGVLVNPGNPSGPKLIVAMQAAATVLNLTIDSVEATTPQGLDAAFAALLKLRPEALMVMPDSMLFNDRERIAEFALKNRLPLLASNREIVDAGALSSYGVPQGVLFRRSAIYVKKILAGAKPADLPVEQPTQFHMAVNLKTAKALGLTIPPIWRLQVDEWVE